MSLAGKILILLLSLWFTSPSFACLPPENYERLFDFPKKREQVGIILGVVEQIDSEHFGDKACLLIEYSQVEIIHGGYNAPIRNAVCHKATADSADVNRLLNSMFFPSPQDHGMYVGAKVITILTDIDLNVDASAYRSPPTGYLRPLVFSCWGIFHGDLGSVTNEEKDKFIAEFLSDLEKSFPE